MYANYHIAQLTSLHMWATENRHLWLEMATTWLELNSGRLDLNSVDEV